MSGWICSHRKKWDHPLFKGNALYAGLWDWMICKAAWEKTRFDVKGKTLTLDRGQLCVSLSYMAEETGAGVQVVRTFLRRLEAENAISRKSAHGLTQSRTVITICNYEKYQSKEDVANTDTNTVPTQCQHTKEQLNTSVLRTGEDRRDPAAVIFTDCLAVLTDGGVPIKQARSLLGKWRKQHGDEAVIAATGKAKREGAVDPVAFIEGCFRHKRKVEASNDDRLSAWGIKDHDAEDARSNFSRGRDSDPPPNWNAEDGVSDVLPFPQEEDRPVSERDLQAGRDRLELLALRA